MIWAAFAVGPATAPVRRLRPFAARAPIIRRPAVARKYPQEPAGNPNPERCTEFDKHPGRAANRRKSPRNPIAPEPFAPSPRAAQPGQRPPRQAVVVILFPSLESPPHFNQRRTAAASRIQAMIGKGPRAKPDPAGHNRGVEKRKFPAVRECDPAPFARNKSNE
jgi:hypothetical protein